MVFTVRYILGVYLVLISSAAVHSAALHHRKVREDAQPPNKPTPQLQLKTENSTENKTTSTSTPPPIEELTTNLPNYIFEQDIKKQSDARTENARSLDFDINKYTSSEFHNKNNVYNVPTSPENEKYISEYTHKATTFKIPSDITTPRLQPFENSHPEDTNVNDFIEKAKQNNTSHTNLNFVKYSNIITDGKIDKNSARKTYETEKGLQLDFASVYNDTELINEEVVVTSKTPVTNEIKKAELQGRTERASTTRYRTKSPPFNRTIQQNYILSNKIELEFVKPTTASELNKEVVFSRPTEDNVINIFKRGSTKYINTINSPTTESLNKSNKIHQINGSHEQSVEENNIYPVIVPVPTSTTTVMYEITADTTTESVREVGDYFSTLGDFTTETEFYEMTESTTTSTLSTFYDTTEELSTVRHMFEAGEINTDARVVDKVKDVPRSIKNQLELVGKNDSSEDVSRVFEEITAQPRVDGNENVRLKNQSETVGSSGNTENANRSFGEISTQPRVDEKDNLDANSIKNQSKTMGKSNSNSENVNMFFDGITTQPRLDEKENWRDKSINNQSEIVGKSSSKSDKVNMSFETTLSRLVEKESGNSRSNSNLQKSFKDITIEPPVVEKENVYVNGIKNETVRTSNSQNKNNVTNSFEKITIPSQVIEGDNVEAINGQSVGINDLKSVPQSVTKENLSLDEVRMLVKDNEADSREFMESTTGFIAKKDNLLKKIDNSDQTVDLHKDVSMIDEDITPVKFIPTKDDDNYKNEKVNSSKTTPNDESYSEEISKSSTTPKLVEKDIYQKGSTKNSSNTVHLPDIDNINYSSDAEEITTPLIITDDLDSDYKQKSDKVPMVEETVPFVQSDKNNSSQKINENIEDRLYKNSEREYDKNSTSTPNTNTEAKSNSTRGYNGNSAGKSDENSTRKNDGRRSDEYSAGKLNETESKSNSERKLDDNSTNKSDENSAGKLNEPSEHKSDINYERKPDENSAGILDENSAHNSNEHFLYKSDDTAASKSDYEKSTHKSDEISTVHRKVNDDNSGNSAHTERESSTLQFEDMKKLSTVSQLTPTDISSTLQLDDISTTPTVLTKDLSNTDTQKTELSMLTEKMTTNRQPDILYTTSRMISNEQRSTSRGFGDIESFTSIPQTENDEALSKEKVATTLNMDTFTSIPQIPNDFTTVTNADVEETSTAAIEETTTSMDSTTNSKGETVPYSVGLHYRMPGFNESETTTTKNSDNYHNKPNWHEDISTELTADEDLTETINFSTTTSSFEFPNDTSLLEKTNTTSLFEISNATTIYDNVRSNEESSTATSFEFVSKQTDSTSTISNNTTETPLTTSQNHPNPKENDILKTNITHYNSTDKNFIPPDVDEDDEFGDEDYIELHNKKVNHTSTDDILEPIDSLLPTTTKSGAAQSSTTISATSVETTTINDEENEINTTEEITSINPDDDGGGGTVIAIIISSVGAICLVILAGLLFVMRRRQKRFNYGQRCTPVSLDAYSMDNVSVYNSVRRKAAMRGSKRSYGNPAFDDSSVSHPLNFQALIRFATNSEEIKSEYEDIPQVTARMNELPEGCDTKNRYANIIPLPETRVFLNSIEDDPTGDYINANYVTGPKGVRGYYIACQAPLQNTVNDFWRMIWEQQSKVVIMLTHLYENGVEKCVDYLPPSEVLDCHRLFGDYQVTLKKREVKDKYIISSLQLKNMVSNSWREVTHLWYSGWPEKGVPTEENSLIAFLIEARSFVKLVQNNLDVKFKETNGNVMNAGNPDVSPVVVHCSPGTGRTGTVIACDIAIREFELKRVVDIPKVVYRIRRDRASSVQTKDQYAFIYKVINLYATKLTGGALDSI